MTFRQRGFVLVVMLSVLPSTFAQQRTSPHNRLDLEITGLRNDKGHVRCSLFSSAEDFPGKLDKALRVETVAVSKNHAPCDFNGVPAGTYAVSVFHDENSNGKLDTNFLGIPREGVGASNNARGHLGPPRFEAAAFHFSGGQLNLVITIHYF
jgi:uncharacterized protein (DUF2141 family)